MFSHDSSRAAKSVPGAKEGVETMKQSDIDNIFIYHAPTLTQTSKYEELRDMARGFAGKINEHCPESREKSLALTYLQQVVMWANAAIAIHDGEKKDVT